MSWPLIARGSRGGKPPTGLQEKIIKFCADRGMPPFGESSSRAEIEAEFPDAAKAKTDEVGGGWSVLDWELYDAVCAGWLKCYPGETFDAWERPRPERTDLPVEDRGGDKSGAWTDSSGGKHFGNMAYEGDDDAMAEAMKAISDTP